MTRLFGVSVNSKFAIMRASWKRRPSKLFLRGLPELGDSSQAVLLREETADDKSSPKTPTEQSPTPLSPSSPRDVPAEIDEQQRIFLDHSDLKSDDVAVDIKQSFSPMYLPGRIYHMVPVKMPKRCCSGSRRRFVIYPAHQKTFQEIVMNRSMFTDHMPSNYTMREIEVRSLPATETIEDHPN